MTKTHLSLRSDEGFITTQLIAQQIVNLSDLAHYNKEIQFVKLNELYNFIKNEFSFELFSLFNEFGLLKELFRFHFAEKINLDSAPNLTFCSQHIFSLSKINVLDIMEHNNVVRLMALIDREDTFKFKTPLWRAVLDGETEVVRALVKYGADIESTEYTSGHTPLVTAIALGFKEIVKILLSNNCNLDYKTSLYESVLDCAVLHASIKHSSQSARDILTLVLNAVDSQKARILKPQTVNEPSRDLDDQLHTPAVNSGNNDSPLLTLGESADHSSLNLDLPP